MTQSPWSACSRQPPLSLGSFIFERTGFILVGVCDVVQFLSVTLIDCTYLSKAWSAGDAFILDVLNQTQTFHMDQEPVNQGPWRSGTCQSRTLTIRNLSIKDLDDQEALTRISSSRNLLIRSLSIGILLIRNPITDQSVVGGWSLWDRKEPETSVGVSHRKSRNIFK